MIYAALSTLKSLQNKGILKIKDKTRKSLGKGNNTVEKEEEKGKGKGKELKETEAMTGSEMKVSENLMEAIRRKGSKEENNKQNNKENNKESKRRNKMGETYDNNDDSNDDDDDNDDDDNNDDGNNDETFEYFNYHSLWLSNVRVQCLLMTSFSTSMAQERYLQKGNKERYLQKGNEERYLQKGNEERYLQKGNKEMDPVTGRDRQGEIMRNEVIKNKAGDKKQEDKRVGGEVEKEVEADWSESLDGTFKHHSLNFKIRAFFVLLLKSEKTFIAIKKFSVFFYILRKILNILNNLSILNNLNNFLYFCFLNNKLLRCGRHCSCLGFYFISYGYAIF